MSSMEKKVYKLREELKKQNPLIGTPEIIHLLMPTAYLTNFNDKAFWAEKENRNLVFDCLYRTGCSRVSGKGIELCREFVADEESSYGCWWNAYSKEFFKPLNELKPKDIKRADIYDLSKKLDLTNKTELIIDNSNTGQYFWIPDRRGEKTIDEACSVVTTVKKECLPSCSLKKICGKDYRVQVATPQQLAERVLIPLIDKSWGPLPKNDWDEIKNMSKEVGNSVMEEFRRKAKGENADAITYAR